MSSHLGVHDTPSKSKIAKASIYGSSKPENFKLNGVDYFHGYTRREFCDEILTDEGDFLIRRGRHQSDYVLSIKSEGEVKHVKANTNEQGLYYFCFPEVAFSSMSELISAHFNNKYAIAKDKTGKILILRPVPIPTWIFDPSRIAIYDFIGRGSSCDVWRGSLTMLNGQVEIVALKIPRVSDNEQSCELLHEARILRHLNHPNVVHWRGIVNKDEEMMLVLEFVKSGTLAQLLSRLSFRGKVRACLDISKGLNYLHTAQLIHRNMAARNCLCEMSDNGSLIVKISDLCLCRGGGENAVYKLDTVHAIPAGWTAPESLNNQEWSTASDVWSFGVVLWEIFTNGQQPYKNVLKKVDVESMKHYLLQLQKRLVPPKEMPLPIVEIMTTCFFEQREIRPSMRTILEKLQAFYDEVPK